MTNYNCVKYLDTAIKSILAQTYKDWELIFVDDVSTDGSFKAAKKYKDERVRVFRHKVNGGFGKTLRTAASKSTGEILCMLDSDDWVCPDTLEILDKAYKENPDVGLIYTQYYHCYDNLKIQRLGDCGPLPDGMTWLDVLLKTPKPRPRVGHLKTFKRDAYNKTAGFTTKRRSVDKDIVFKLEEVTKLLFVDVPLYYWRKHKTSISRNSPSNQKYFVNEAIRRRKHGNNLEQNT